jgi:hypothetical protein
MLKSRSVEHVCAAERDHQQRRVLLRDLQVEPRHATTGKWFCPGGIAGTGTGKLLKVVLFFPKADVDPRLRFAVVATPYGYGARLIDSVAKKGICLPGI